jgi:hypothetical protein
MTLNEAKKDCAARLKAHGCIWSKISAKSVSFQDLLRANSTRVIITDCIAPKDFNKDTCFMGIPKSTQGGYLPCFRIDHAKKLNNNIQLDNTFTILEGTHFNKYDLAPIDS